MAQSAQSIIGHLPDLRDPVVRRTTRDRVAENIAALMTAGILQVGDVLPSERDLAGAFQVSRETVRGGMQILAAHGAIEITHGARTRVVKTALEALPRAGSETRRVNSYDIDSVHAARLLVEREVVAKAAREIDPASIDFLKSCLTSQRTAVNDPVRFLIYDREFHFTIYRACDNRPLADFVSDLYVHMMDHRRRAVARQGAIRASISDHEAILDGLVSRDEAKVVAAFNIHLDRIYQTTRRIINGHTTEAR